MSRCIDEAMSAKYYLALSLEQTGRLERSLEIFSEVRVFSLQNPNYKLVTIEQVDSVLNRIQETRNKKLVLSTVYQFN